MDTLRSCLPNMLPFLVLFSNLHVKGFPQMSDDFKSFAHKKVTGSLCCDSFSVSSPVSVGQQASTGGRRPSHRVL